MTTELQREYGVIEPAPGVLARRWDRRPDFRPGEEADHGWIGEDEEGVWLRRHPESVLAEDPELQAVFGQWRFTAQRKIALRDQRECSNWFLTAWSALYAAAHRPSPEDDDDG